MEANLKTAKRIIGTFLIDVTEYPEYLVENPGGSETCERNKLVAQCLLAIEDLQKWI